MFIKALLTTAAAGSLMIAAGSAMAEDYNNSPNSAVNQPQSSSTWSDPSARPNYDATLQTQGDETAATPSAANVASTSDLSTPAVTTEVIASAPVPDTPQNRAAFGQPMSHAGRMTAPRGN